MTPAGYKSSPFPTFDGGAHVPYVASVLHRCGEGISSELAGCIYDPSGIAHQNRNVSGHTPNLTFDFAPRYVVDGT